MTRLGCILVGIALWISAVPAAAEDFRLERYFAGRTVAEGRFRTITGVSRAFTVNLVGRWNGRTLTLVENFRYKDGERDRKTWRLTKTGRNTYSGTREDVVGKTNVTVSGNTAVFSYSVYLDSKNRKQLVRFNDRMTLRDDGTVLNNAVVTKFGFPVAWTRVEFSRR